MYLVILGANKQNHDFLMQNDNFGNELDLASLVGSQLPEIVPHS